jgi:hypothetical protein
METAFLSCLLVFSLLCILILYLYQLNPSILKKNKSIGEQFLPIIFDTCNNQRTGSMPVHRVGPVINFHQSFNNYNPALMVGMPTGNPYMGWRNFYLKNFTQYQVPEQDPFVGTPVRNFLNNLENVDNIYRKCL